MRTKSMSMLSLLITVMFCISTVGLANIWMDENFDGTSIFVQGDGGGTAVSPSNATLDVYSNTQPVANQLNSVLTQTGAKVTSKFFDGTACYQIETAETVAIATPYQDQTNGPFIILQFAVNVDPIPSAGDVGEFRFDWDTDTGNPPSPAYSFYVKLVSNGSTVDIKAGQDVGTPSEASIGTLNSTSDWKFVTMVMQNNTGSETYNQTNLPGGSLTQNEGVAFYCSSTTQGHFVAMTGNSGSKSGLGWDITVSSGTVYIDTLYWEGAMDQESAPAGTGAINIRPFDYSGASAVSNWALY